MRLCRRSRLGNGTDDIADARGERGDGRRQRSRGRRGGVIDWSTWHEAYDDPESSLARRLAVVRRRIGEALDRCRPGQIRVLSMCAGEGRDLLGLLEGHARAADVSGRLVELDPVLAARARTRAPQQIEVLTADAGHTDAYEGAVPADVVLCCGVFGHLSDEDVVRTIWAWRMLCKPGATIIWTRGGPRRDDVRRWVTDAGFFEEIAFDGPPETYGVGVARLTASSEPYRSGERIFTFGSIDTRSRDRGGLE